MSTRSTINFGYGIPAANSTAKPTAKIYRHSDGYPEGVLADLDRFYEAVTEGTPRHGPRLGDPSYLAAKFVVWQAGENAKPYNSETGEYEETENPLDFLSLGILSEDPGDIEFTYWINELGNVLYRTAGFRGNGEWKLAGKLGALNAAL